MRDVLCARIVRGITRTLRSAISLLLQPRLRPSHMQPLALVRQSRSHPRLSASARALYYFLLLPARGWTRSNVSQAAMSRKPKSSCITVSMSVFLSNHILKLFRSSELPFQVLCKTLPIFSFAIVPLFLQNLGHIVVLRVANSLCLFLRSRYCSLFSAFGCTSLILSDYMILIVRSAHSFRSPSTAYYACTSNHPEHSPSKLKLFSRYGH